MRWEYMEMMVDVEQMLWMADRGAADREKKHGSLDSSPIPGNGGKSWFSAARVMNHFGEDDWELVGTVASERSGFFRLFFKRHK